MPGSACMLVAAAQAWVSEACITSSWQRPAHQVPDLCRYVRLGRWHDGVVSAVDSVEADAADAAVCQAPYDPEHNVQMLIYVANMAGEVKHSHRTRRLWWTHAGLRLLRSTACMMPRGWAGYDRLAQSVMQTLCIGLRCCVHSLGWPGNMRPRCASSRTPSGAILWCRRASTGQSSP